MTSVEEWLVEHLPGWSDLEKTTTRSIRDFPILWALFELRATNARAGVQTIIHAVERLDHYEEAKATAVAVSYFSDRYHSCLNAVDRKRKLKLTATALAVVDGVISGDQNDPKARLKAVLLIIHRLRNNFLHGEKARYAYQDQPTNFQISNDVLMAVAPLWVVST